jgi:hypothetical protein
MLQLSKLRAVLPSLGKAVVAVGFAALQAMPPTDNEFESMRPPDVTLSSPG